MKHNTLINDNCINTMKHMPANSYDAIITDPPYELGFLGHAWDKTGIAFDADTWANCLRVAKPGAHLLAFGGSRTFHHIASAIEKGGWEIRDCLLWLYGTGFPKSQNLHGKWEGFGTGLKPAYEPIIVARKPFPGTMTANVHHWGTGALNIDACRIPSDEKTGWSGKPSSGYKGSFTGNEPGGRPVSGRWPANVIHDGSDEVFAAFPSDKSGKSQARFFYCAKASTQDRDEGLKDFNKQHVEIMHGVMSKGVAPRSNIHPTVKPTALMRYLCRLVTPPGGIILDPFSGSGSTGKAAILEGFKFVGIEKEKNYAKIAQARLDWAANQTAAHAWPGGGREQKS